MLKKLNKKLIN